MSLSSSFLVQYPIHSPKTPCPLMGTLRHLLLALLDVAYEGPGFPCEKPRMAEHWVAAWRLNATLRGGLWDGKVSKIGPQSVCPSYRAGRLHTRSSLVAGPGLS